MMVIQLQPVDLGGKTLLSLIHVGYSFDLNKNYNLNRFSQQSVILRTSVPSYLFVGKLLYS